MPDRPSADQIAELLLWFHREPSRYRAQGRRRDAPALDPEVILKLALGRRIEFAKAALNAPALAAELQEAAAMYVRLLFFRPDATPYQTLGLATGASQQAIKESFRLLMHLVHPDRQDARAALKRLRQASVHPIGAVMTKLDLRDGTYGYESAYYYYRSTSDVAQLT